MNIVIGTASTITVAGGNNTIVASGTADVIALAGGNNVVTAGYGTLFDSGSADTLNVWGEAVTFAANVVNDAITNGWNTVTLGAGDTVSLFGSNGALGYNNVITMAAHDTLTINSGAFDIVNGAGSTDIVNIASTSAGWMDVNGNGGTINLAAQIQLNTSGETVIAVANDAFNLTGSGDVVNEGADDILNLGGGGDTITMGPSAYLGLLGGSGYQVFGSGDTIATAGTTSFTLTGNNDTINTGPGTVAVVGSSDTITAAAGDTVSLFGSNGVLGYNNVIAMAASDTLTINSGAFDIVNGAGSTDIVNIASTSAGWMDVNGNGGTINLAAQIQLNTSGETVIAVANDAFNLTGSGDVVNEGADDILNLGGGGDTITMGPSAYLGLLGGSGYQVFGSGDTIATAGTTSFTLTGNNDTINTGPGTVAVVGSSDTITAAAGDTVSLFGSNGVLGYNNVIAMAASDTLTINSGAFDIVNGAGSTDIVNIASTSAGWMDVNGNGGTINLAAQIQLNTSGETVIAVANDAFNLTGSGDVVNEGADDILNLGGGGDTITMGPSAYLGLLGGSGYQVFGSGDTIATAGTTSFTLTGNNDTINTGPGTVAVVGSSDTITAAAGDTVSLFGSNGALGYNNVIAMAAHDTLTINSGAFDIVNGAGSTDIVNIASTSAGWMDVNGNGGTINLAAQIQLNTSGETVIAVANDAFNLTGSGDVVNEGADDILNLGGGGDTITMGPSAYLGLLGGSGYQVFGSGDTIATAGTTSFTLTGNNDTINTGPGTVAVVGSSDTITAAAGDTVSLFGSNGALGYNNVIAMAAHDTLTINSGAFDIVNGAGSTDIVNIASTSAGWMDVNGNGGTINLAAQIQLNTSGETVIAVANDAFNLTGSGDVVNEGADDILNLGGGGDTITMGPSAYLGLLGGSGYQVFGSGDTIATAGTTSFTLTGNNDTINTGPGTVAVVGSSDTITAAAGDTVSLFGSNGVLGYNNVIAMAASDTLTINSGAFDIVNGAGSTDIVNIASTSAGWMDVNGNGGTINLAAQIQLNTSGETVIAVANDAFNLTGSGDVVNEGADDILNLGGGGDTITMGPSAYLGLLGGSGYQVFGSGDTIATAGTTSFTLTGNNDTINTGPGATITFTGSNEVINIAGNGVTVYVTGTGDTLVAEGTGEMIFESSGTVDLGSGASATVSGGGDTIIDSGGNGGSQVTLENTYNDQDTVTTNGPDTIWMAQNSEAAISGGGTTGNTINIIANNDMVTAGPGQAIGVGGTGEMINGSSDLVWLNNAVPATATVNGGGDMIIDSGGNGGSQVTLENTYNNLDTVATSGADTVWMGQSGGATIDGGGNSGNTTNIIANNDTVAAGPGQRIGVGGTGEVINASSDWVWLNNNTSATVAGNGNTITDNVGNGGVNVTLNGGGDTTTLYDNGGSQVTVENSYSDQDTVTTNAAATVWMAQNGDAAINGGGPSGNTTNIIGNNDTVAAGPGQTIGVGGTGEVIDGSFVKVWLNNAVPAIATVNGGGNTIIDSGGNGGSQVTLENTYSNWDTVATSAPDTIWLGQNGYANVSGGGSTGNTILLSPDSVAAIQATYDAVLDRDPSPDELSSAEAEVATGTSLNDLQAQLASSAEAQSDMNSTYAAATGPYQALMDALPQSNPQLGNVDGVDAQIISAPTQTEFNAFADAMSASYGAPIELFSVDPLSGAETELADTSVTNLLAELPALETEANGENLGLQLADGMQVQFASTARTATFLYSLAVQQLQATSFVTDNYNLDMQWLGSVGQPMLDEADFWSERAQSEGGERAVLDTVQANLAMQIAAEGTSGQTMSVTIYNAATGNPTQITVYAGGGSTIHDEKPGIGHILESAFSTVINIAAVAFPYSGLPFLAAAIDGAQAGQAFNNGQDIQGILSLAQAVGMGANGFGPTQAGKIILAATQGVGGIYGIVKSAESGNDIGILAGALEAAAAGATGIGLYEGGQTQQKLNAIAQGLGVAGVAAAVAGDFRSGNLGQGLVDSLNLYLPAVAQAFATDSAPTNSTSWTVPNQGQTNTITLFNEAAATGEQAGVEVQPSDGSAPPAIVTPQQGDYYLQPIRFLFGGAATGGSSAPTVPTVDQFNQAIANNGPSGGLVLLEQSLGLGPISSDPNGYNNFVPGYHQYAVQGTQGYATPQDGFADLLAAPAGNFLWGVGKFLTGSAPSPVQSSGQVTNLPIVGPITTFVDPKDFTIFNVTLPGHVLDPGIVQRSVELGSDGLYHINTYGEGNGIIPSINDNAAGFIFDGRSRSMH